MREPVTVAGTGFPVLCVLFARVRSSMLSSTEVAYRIALLLFHFASPLSRRLHRSVATLQTCFTHARLPRALLLAFKESFIKCGPENKVINLECFIQDGGAVRNRLSVIEKSWRFKWMETLFTCAELWTEQQTLVQDALYANYNS